MKMKGGARANTVLTRAATAMSPNSLRSLSTCPRASHAEGLLLVGRGMNALDEDRFTFPDLGEVQLIDGDNHILDGAWIPNDRDRALGGIRARIFQYQRAAVLGAQYGGQLGPAAAAPETSSQRLRFETEFPCDGDERRSVRLARCRAKRRRSWSTLTSRPSGCATAARARSELETAACGESFVRPVGVCIRLSPCAYG